MSLTDALRDALQLPRPSDSEQQVQETVAKRLEELTPGTNIKRTGYFNHAWAPDLVVRSGDQAERWVYLRFDVKDASFEQDLEYLARERPFFLDLVAANPRDETATVDAMSEGSEPEFDLEAALTERGRDGILVSDTPAVDRFESSVRKDKDVKKATEQVVLGGQGHVDRPAADTIVASWEAATEAVSEGEVSELRRALDKVERYLSRVAAVDLETTVRASWIGAGRSAEEFPGVEDWSLEHRKPWEIARLVLALLKQPTAVSPERWEDIAQAISVSDLGHELYRIGENHEGGAVNDLVTAALPYWTTEFAYVPPLESDSIMGRFDWAIGDYSFELNLVRRRAFFTDLGRKWSRTPRATSLPDARSRLETLEAAGAIGVGLMTTQEKVSHELREDATGSLADRLRYFLTSEGDAAWRAARITWCEARVPGTGAIAHVDFERNVVRTTEAVPLRTYALLVGRLVAGLDDDEMTELEATLEP